MFEILFATIEGSTRNLSRLIGRGERNGERREKLLPIPIEAILDDRREEPDEELRNTAVQDRADVVRIDAVSRYEVVDAVQRKEPATIDNEPIGVGDVRDEDLRLPCKIRDHLIVEVVPALSPNAHAMPSLQLCAMSLEVATRAGEVRDLDQRRISRRVERVWHEGIQSRSVDPEWLEVSSSRSGPQQGLLDVRVCSARERHRQRIAMRQPAPRAERERFARARA